MKKQLAGTAIVALLTLGVLALTTPSPVRNELQGHLLRHSRSPTADTPAGGPDLTSGTRYAPRLERDSPGPTDSPTLTPSPQAGQKNGPPAVAPLRARSGLPAFSHVFLIVMENREYGSIIGSPDAPFINSLAASFGLATNYYATTHPSLPNYIALTAGTTFGIATNCTECFLDGPDLASQIERSGRTWKAYMEDMPSPCYLGASAGGYALRHNPFLYYNSIRNNPARCGRVVPFSQFNADLGANALPNFVWITPNLCNDMHDCDTSVGDAWLKHVASGILNSSAWRNGGVLIITWDEGDTETGCCGNSAGGQVATLIVAPGMNPGFRSTVPSTHYSLLRTVEDAWGLAPLGAAASSSPMREYFSR